MKIKKIGVIYGGKSSEREVSLKTGAAIAKALKKEKFSTVLIDSGKKDFIKKLLLSKIDFAFIALHGPFGEDGTMQGLLEILGISYSGSGVLASALAMNKIYSKKIFESENIPTPKWQVITSVSRLPSTISRLPVVIKPAKQGSAIGITIVRKKSQLKKAIKNALKYDDEAIAEEYIEGTEITVPILGAQPLSPIEIIPKNEFYDFYSKYAAGGSWHLIPPRLSQKIIYKVKQLGFLAHKSLGCRAMSRVDMIVDRKNKIYVLEVNTIPGMTATSLFPESAKYDGYTFGKLLKKIIELSLNEKTQS
ncbi:MAG: D-alanine--D-alanine ligase [Elusimicrobia bacterium CG06_land_8_20_14_3_00_38_11]|nr:MAG: D-alanine--D-alanine ligase [Elusimicrobia bacterium CG06_land_8_20_14_3_00_38_11]